MPHDGGVTENSCGLGSVTHQYVTWGESLCLHEPPWLCIVHMYNGDRSLSESFEDQDVYWVTLIGELK